MTGAGKYKGLLYLAALLVVVPWFVYRVAIADTVRMKRELKQTQREIVRLQNQSRSEGAATGAIAGNALELQSGGLIPRITDCEADARCTVVKYTPYVTESRDGLAVHTAELVLSGTYADLVRLVERAETQLASCRLVSANFKSIRQRQRKPTQLQVTLVLQQICKST
ncbi:hypothetical protein LJC45_00925 [Alistipes sp. OttesenSCG-928-B03]|nr:hypothetical protein [Alistipes sp. OttesenSCG-928-B03]